jgi:peroxiredoxin
MAQLRHDYQNFVDRETEIIAVGPEGPDAFADWWHRHQMPFIGTGDPKHVIAKLFGQQVKLLKLGRMPAQFVIDKEGRMRNVHYGESMQDIITDEEVLALLDEINREQAGSKAA